MQSSEIVVLVPSMLWRYCNERRELPVKADNVQDALDVLKRDFPELHRSVCNETGAVRIHVNLFVNSEFVSRHSDLRSVKLLAGDSLTIMPAVSGG